MTVRAFYRSQIRLGLLLVVILTTAHRIRSVLAADPPGNKAAPVTTSAPAGAGKTWPPVEEISISHSQSTTPSKKGIMVEIGSQFAVESADHLLHHVIKATLGISSVRFEVDPGVPDMLINVRYFHRRVADIAAERAKLSDMICQKFSMELTRIRSKRDVWVLECPADGPPKGGGRTLEEIAWFMEEEFGVLIEVEGCANARSRISYASKEGFEAVRKHLDSTFGIKLTKQSRETTTWRLRAMDTVP